MVDDNSTYNIELPTLADGDYKFKMEAISGATGSVINTVETKTFTIDTNAPTVEWTKVPSTITADGIVYKNGDAPLEFAGKTEPFSDVRIILVDKSNNNAVNMQVRADENGEFSQKVSDMFPKGTYEANVHIVDPAGNWVAPIKLPVTETPATQPSEHTNISDNIFEITKMYTDEDTDLSKFSISKYGDPEDYHDFHPTFEGKASAFADILLDLSIKRYSPSEGKLEYEHRETITTKADANGDWKVETAEEYGIPGARYSDGHIEAKVTNSAGVTFDPAPIDFYMPLLPIRVAPVDHL